MLPQWLIKKTGDPNRTVNISFDFSNKAVHSFSWSSFTAPSCAKCNSDFADLENSVIPIVDKIERREYPNANEFYVLLDWLDKVRIGLWLTHLNLNRNFTNISPMFHISQRVGTKDRMAAIYLVDDLPDGLNAHGAETPLFQVAPSCFALRINQTLIYNVSADFLISGRCGFPSPIGMKLVGNEGAATELNYRKLSCKKRHRTPLLPYPLYMPTIQIYQPIVAKTFDGKYIGENFLVDEFMLNHCIENSDGKGKLLHLKNNVVTVLNTPDAPIEWSPLPSSAISDYYTLASQVYEQQITLHNRIPIRLNDKELQSQLDREYSEYVKISKTLFKAYKKKGATLKKIAAKA